MAGRRLENGLTEIYVNAKIRDGSDVAELMQLFIDRNKYDYEKFPNSSKRKSQFLENEEGEKIMCDIVEEYARERAEEAAKESVRELFKNGASIELVEKSIKGLSKEEIHKIYEAVMQKSE